MADCCIIGCDNKAKKRGEVKFYLLPTARSTRPSNVKRRRLWLEAIEKANGTTEGLSHDEAKICCAHFVSGQMSLDISDQDFIPSVFPKEHTSKSRRQTLRPRSGVLAETPKVTPKKKVEQKSANAPEEVSESNNIFLPENNYCEPLEDEDVLEEEEITQPPSSQIILEQQQIIDYQKLKKPKLQIKSIVERFGQFRCEACNAKFPTASGLVKHKQLHDEEWSDEDQILPPVSDDVEKSEFIDKPVHVKDPSFQCNMCSRSFPTSHSLKRHKLLHVRDNRKCTQCGTMFCKRHNHVVAQPQISTETVEIEEGIEEAETPADDVDETAEFPMLHLSDSDDEVDEVDEGLAVLLNSNSLALDAIAAAQEEAEPSTDKLHKEAPAITYNPRKPGLLIAFKSFLTKHRPDITKKRQRHSIGSIPTFGAIQATASRANVNAATPIKTTAPSDPITDPITAPATPITAPITAPATPITAPITAPASPITAPITAPATPASLITAPATPITAPITTPITAPATPITAPASPITVPITAPITAPATPASLITAPATPITAPITTTTAAVPITACNITTAPAAPHIMASTTGTTAKSVPETSSKIDTLTTCTNALTPKLVTPVIYVAQSLKQTPGEPFQKMDQSKVCLSFSKPLPTNVIKEFMTYISKRESMKSQAPRLVTFTAKQDQEMPKQELKSPPKILPKSNLQTPTQLLPKLNFQTTPQIQIFQSPKRTSIAKKVRPSPTMQASHKRPYVHGSRPPSPEPIFAKVKRGPWDSPIPNYPKDFIQPHLPQTPKLPPELQMFSPQFLTSAMLDVERNFEYILSDTLVNAKTS